MTNSMKSKVYLETTIVSTWPPSRRVSSFRLRTNSLRASGGIVEGTSIYSQPVISEAGAGNAEAASRRLAALEGIPSLAVTAEARIWRLSLSATVDALHVAIAVVNGVDYVLAWNCTHIANAAIRDKIERTCREAGFEPPIICTPEELME